MVKKIEPILRIICLALGVLVLAQVVVRVVRRDVGATLVVPAGLAATAKPEAKLGSAPESAPTNERPAGFPGAPAPLPAAVQARVDKVTQSEVLGPVMRPPPMALLGIAGKQAVLRAPNGQTGIIGEGEQLGGIKLLRIGTNRVLIEENGQPKELSIFAGLGGDSLMPTGKDKPQ